MGKDRTVTDRSPWMTRLVPVPIDELARLAHEPGVGVAYAEFLLRLRELPASITSEEPTQLSGRGLDDPEVPPSWPPEDRRPQAVEFEALREAADANREVVVSLLSDFREARFEILRLIREAESTRRERGIVEDRLMFEVGDRPGIAFGPYAERLRSLFDDVTQTQRRGTSIIRAIDWEYHRVWEAVGGAYARTINIDAATEEARRLRGR